MIKDKLYLSLDSQSPIRIWVLLGMLLMYGLCAGQQAGADTVRKPESNDTAQVDFFTRIKRLGAAEVSKSAVKFKEGRIAIRQDEVLENLIKTTQKAKDYLKNGIDTFRISRELDKIDNWYAVISDGVFVNNGTAQTNRNLALSSQLLRELIYKTSLQKTKLDTYHKDLFNFRDKLDSLFSDSIIYDFPDDSAATRQYLQKIAIAAQTVNPADSSLQTVLSNIQSQQKRVNQLANMLDSRFEEIEVYRRELSDKTFDREFANLGNTIGFTRPFTEIIRFSKAKEIMALWFYASDHAGAIVLLLCLIIAAALFLYSLKEKIAKEGVLRKDFSGQLVFRYPALSAITIVLNLFQFIFIDPPFIFNVWFWIVSATCLTIIFWKYISAFWMVFWFTMLALFLLACADNAILQASRTERWYMVVLALAGVLAGTYFLVKGRRKELKEKAILYFIGLAVLLELIALVANFYGRYNLSKTLLTSGYFNVIIGILFLWTVRMINEVLTLAAAVYKKPEPKLFYINFDKVGSKVPAVFYVLLVIGWFVLFARNFYAYKLISEPFEYFLVAERKVGAYTFTIRSVLTFFVILLLSAILSKIVSFFATESKQAAEGPGKTVKMGIGSWLLLIRITIISAGLFLAFAAAGIPMDRITIIVGALSVGIGFGLQTLINNLVSGLIIAFEKPVNVGDIVEIAGKAGTMKSIGFRSSVIATWEGSDVIIPNGDLLNQHLVNWTLSDTMRRVEVMVGVAYGTDMEKAKQLLNDMLVANENILKYPNPVILFNDFNNSAIEIRILFWVKHYLDWIAAKSEVIAAVDMLFKQHGITIPFPQRDVHIYNAKNDGVNTARQSENKT